MFIKLIESIKALCGTDLVILIYLRRYCISHVIGKQKNFLHRKKDTKNPS